MSNPLLTAVLLAVAGAQVLAGAQAASALRPAQDRPEQSRATSARTRTIYVSALDRDGAPVPDLGVKDVAVREDGAAREVLKVERATDPMQIVVLVDDSQAADPAMRSLCRR